MTLAYDLDGWDGGLGEDGRDGQPGGRGGDGREKKPGGQPKLATWQ